MSTQTVTCTAGPVNFARYAYAPNALGYCGPADHRSLLAHGAGASAEPRLRALAAGFEGAWPYLQLIAESCAITDPLDPRVVEAYWVGNRWLERVDRQRFATFVSDRLASMVGADPARLATRVAGAVPHHSFQVFVVYPWVDLLGVAGGGRALHVLDRCRIRWGRVLSVEGDDVEVRSRPLCWDGRRLHLGSPVRESAVTGADGYRLAPRCAPGDWVSLHWGWVCDRLDERRLVELRRYSARQLAETNEHIARSSAGG